MKASRKPWGALALGLLLASSGWLLAAAQQPPPSEQRQGPIEPQAKEEKTPYALRVEVPLVDVEVTVVDKNGNFIHGLQRGHFRVYLDGEEQEVVAFAPTEAPLTTVLLVEATPLVGYLLYQNVDTAYLFLQQLRKEDWVALIGYDLKPRIEVDFTRNRNDIVNALRHMQYGFGRFSEANLYDALIDTLDRLKDVEGKKSIILIGSGFDTFSQHTWDDARRIAREQRTTIFTIGMTWLIELALDRSEARGYRTSTQRMDIYIAQSQLRDLAKQTGGRAYFPRFITQMPSIYQEIGAMLRNQYSLAFRPRDFQRDGKFHKIEVKLVGPNGEPLKVVDQNGKKVKYEVYARKGFYAPEA
ncbi:MAG: VWA domain-containing protein [Candidatus Acidoferrales bacterium]